MKRPYISGPDAHGVRPGQRVLVGGTSWKAIAVESLNPPVVSLRRWRWYDEALSQAADAFRWAFSHRRASSDQRR
jgi:hypothetical protein